MSDELTDPLDAVFGTESDEDFNPQNPFAVEPDDDTDDPEVEDPSEDDDEGEETENETDEPEGEEEVEEEYDPDLLLEPVEVAGRWYTSVSALTQALAEAQNHISSTSRDERTPLREALSGESSSWEADWQALSPNDQAFLQAEFQRNPAELAQRLAQDVRILGKPLTEFVFNEWAKQEPYKAMNWAMEEQKRVAQWEREQQGGYDQPNEYVQNIIDREQSAEAEEIVAASIHNWNPEIAAEVAEFIELNGEALGLREADVSTAEGMADFVTKSYYYLQGLKADMGYAPEPEAPKKTPKKKAGYTPAKGAAAPSTSDEPDPVLDGIFGSSDDSGFQFPKF